MIYTTNEGTANSTSVPDSSNNNLSGEQTITTMDSSSSRIGNPHHSEVLGISAGLSLLISLMVILIYHKFISYRDDDNLNEIQRRIANLERKLGGINQISVVNREKNPNRYTRQSTLTSQFTAKEKEPEVAVINQSETTSYPPLQISAFSTNKSYIYLNVSDGKLVPSNKQTSYYRVWRENGNLLYEFYCDESKMKKAINNRSVLIDPFCMKEKNSVEADLAKQIISNKPGKLDENFTVLDPTIIKFI